MRAVQLTSAWALAVLCLACSADRLAGPLSRNSAATAACGPADGPAVMIYLASSPVTTPEPAPPFFRVAIWQSIDELEGRSWNVAGDGAGAAVSRVQSTTDFEYAVSGTVRVDAVSEARTVKGHVDATFPNADRLRTDFEAHWIPRMLVCG